MVAQEDFYDSLRVADQLLIPMKATWPGAKTTYFRGDPWLTPKSVEGFDPADFADWPEEDRQKLQAEVEKFLEIAREVPPKTKADKVTVKQARKHLEAAIKIVRRRVLAEWLEAQEQMMQVAEAAAKARGWYVEKDEMKLEESLLRAYKAPRLLMRTWDREMMLMPVARFCAGRKGAVDLMVSPTYDRLYAITFKDGRWDIISYQGRQNKRPFTQQTFGNTIGRLSQF